jgi:hypothetical protein
LSDIGLGDLVADQTSLTSVVMASTKLPVRYEDEEYQKAHTSLFCNSITRTLKPTLPPGVGKAKFQAVIDEFVLALGPSGVLIGKALVDYVDPYELYEDVDSERKVPSAAVL